jgi:hypothetical protein
MDTKLLPQYLLRNLQKAFNNFSQNENLIEFLITHIFAVISCPKRLI